MAAVYKRDFRAFFTSPAGYVYVGSYIFALNIYFYVENIAGLYSDLTSSFSFLLFVMMFTTPILTMRSFSEEYKQKTDQLLLTAPVKPSHIVLGKYFACMSVFALVLVLTLFWPLVVSLYGSPNAASIIGNYVLALAVAGVYAAIGAFISSLTESQAAAAVLSLGVYVGLYLIDMVAAALQSASVSVFASVLEFISLTGRMALITQGVFSLADLVFYISAGAVFLFLTVRVLEGKRRG